MSLILLAIASAAGISVHWGWWLFAFVVWVLE